uniref:Peroxisomal membrane protein PEX14-like KPWE domain-containing protein n=1 Tax=Mola mola TaxID=94237 RepID=A0A3Q3WRW0_MOLML
NRYCSASHRVTQTDCERPDQPSRSDSGVGNNLTSQTSAETQAMPLSFVEVMRLVQEGKEVPGVTKVDVEPTNQSPTPSRMERMLKPWEISFLSPRETEERHRFSPSMTQMIHCSIMESSVDSFCFQL